MASTFPSFPLPTGEGGAKRRVRGTISNQTKERILISLVSPFFTAHAALLRTHEKVFKLSRCSSVRYYESGERRIKRRNGLLI